jgi:monosaccharide-transporting ATPase
VLRLSDRVVVMRDRRKIAERDNVDLEVADVLQIIAGEAVSSDLPDNVRPIVQEAPRA